MFKEFWEKRGFRKVVFNWGGIAFVFLLSAILSIVLAPMLESKIIYILTAACFLLICWPIRQITNTYNLYMEMYRNTLLAQKRMQEIALELSANDFKASKHFSAFAYNYIEYRNDFKATDNIHIWLDEENKRIAYAKLLPNLNDVSEPKHFKIYEYSDLRSTKIVAKYEETSVRKILTELYVRLEFAGGDYGSIMPVNDNQRYNCDTPEYDEVVQQAEDFKKLLDEIIESSQEG